MDLPALVRELRKATGDTQQVFARRLGLSPSAIANYEDGREPTSRALYQLGKVAREIGRDDLADQFSSALSENIGAGVVIDIDESVGAGIAHLLFRNNGDDWLQAELESLIARARKDPTVLTSPKAFPDPRRRLAYLESLLVWLRKKMNHSATDIVEALTSERSKETGETKAEAMVWVLTTYPHLAHDLNQERSQASAGMQYVSLPMFDLASFSSAKEEPNPIPTEPKKRARASRPSNHSGEKGD